MMMANYVIERSCPQNLMYEIAFAGDGVRLAGQVDYPTNKINATERDTARYPLLFILPHAGWTDRRAYQNYTRTALNAGYAVFQWDRRGTGRSGAAGVGSATLDAVRAYQTALSLAHINPARAVILAQGESTSLLTQNYGLFRRIGRPAGVLLAANRSSPAATLALDTALYILQGADDWNDPAIYAREAAAIHNQTYAHGAGHYIVPDADHDLLRAGRDDKAFHLTAVHKIQDWLKSL